MTDQMQNAHAAGIRKDRLSSRGQRRRHAWSEAKGATGRPALLFALQPPVS